MFNDLTDVETGWDGAVLPLSMPTDIVVGSAHPFPKYPPVVAQLRDVKDTMWLTRWDLYPAEEFVPEIKRRFRKEHEQMHNEAPDVYGF